MDKLSHRNRINNIFNYIYMVHLLGQSYINISYWFGNNKINTKVYKMDKITQLAKISLLIQVVECI